MLLPGFCLLIFTCFPKVSKGSAAANNFKEKWWNTHFVTQEQSAEGCRHFCAEIVTVFGFAEYLGVRQNQRTCKHVFGFALTVMVFFCQRLALTLHRKNKTGARNSNNRM